MNILHLHTGLNITCGISKTIYLVSKYLNDDFRHIIIAENGDAKDKFEDAGLKVNILNLSRKNFYNKLKIYFFLKKYVKDNNIHIIHSHHRYFDLISFLIRKTLPVKTITSVQSKVTGKKYLSYKADKLIAVSNTIKLHLLNYFGIKPEKISIINNFVDISEINNLKDSKSMKDNLAIQQNKFLIGYIGRISVKEKGVDLLLEAFNEFNKQYTNSFLILVGQGDNENYVNEFIKKEKLSALLIPQKEKIFDYYNILDIIIIPSKVDPFPLVALESGLMKIPVIASGVDGLAELIVDKVDGLLFEKNNYKELLQCMENFYIDARLREYCATNLNRKILENFTNEVIIEKYRNLYLKVLSE